MTPQGAIEIIKIAIAEVEWNYPMEYAEAFENAIEALEKQIPKKPVKIGEDYNAERGIWVADYECPSCGNPYADDSFCSCCGQALDWGDKE